MSTVGGGNDEFALRIGQVAAPVGDKAVRADRLGFVFVAALAAVADDGVVGNGGGQGEGVDGFDEAVVGGQGVDAVGHAFHGFGVGVVRDFFDDFIAGPE